MFAKEFKINPGSDYYLYQPSAIASKIYFYPIATGHFIYDAGYSMKRNRYDSFLLMYLVKGSCRFSNGSDSSFITASRDHFIFIDCYQPHEYEFLSSAEVYWIHFDGPLARNYYDLITESQGNLLSPCNSCSLLILLTKILQRFQTASTVHESEISDYITQILSELLNNKSDTDSVTPSPTVIGNSLAYINEHFHETLTLEQLAEHVNLSPYYFTRVFTAETGFTPHQYLIATRINSAKYLLNTTAVSIKDIAFSCGFHSESSFCSTFKKWESVTPSEFRIRSHPSS